MKTTWKGALLALAAIFVVGCGGTSSAPQETGGMAFTVRTAPAASAPVLATAATLTIKGPKDYVESWDAPPFTFDESPCPIGHYTYTIAATGAGGATFSGAGEFDIGPGQVTQIVVLLQQDNAVPMQVVAPYTESVQFTLPGPNTGGWGVPLDLKAFVTHPNNQSPDLAYFVYTWDHACTGQEIGGPATFVEPGAIFINGRDVPTAEVKTIFTSYCQGVETITFTAVNTNLKSCPNAGCMLTSTVSFDIPYNKQGYAGEITVNFAPKVSCNAVDNAEPLPGGTVHLAARAVDPDGDAMTYAWKDDCGGTFDDATIINPLWTAPAGKYCQACTLSLTVTDARGGVNTGTIGVKTAPADITKGCLIIVQ